MKTSKNGGFTLIELMVVAVIVAILAAVLIPLIAGNKDRAMATEGQAGISAIRTAIRVYEAEFSLLPTDKASGAIDDLPGIGEHDLDGTYFNNASYVYDTTSTNLNSAYTITANGIGAANGKNVVLTVAAGGSTTWSGSLLD
jgi:prepilin-type N-terminal cleavage/methylation domain-containing protein